VFACSVTSGQQTDDRIDHRCRRRKPPVVRRCEDRFG
jgi:hypothetical protein